MRQVKDPTLRQDVPPAPPTQDALRIRFMDNGLRPYRAIINMKYIGGVKREKIRYPDSAPCRATKVSVQLRLNEYRVLKCT